MLPSMHEPMMSVKELQSIPVPLPCKTCMYLLWTVNYVQTPNFSCGCFRQAFTTDKIRGKCSHRVSWITGKRED